MSCQNDAVRSVLVGALLLGGACSWGLLGCSSSCNACIEGMTATLDLTCGPSNLSEVRLTGVCSSSSDVSASHYVFGNPPSHVWVASDQPGACHVELLFQTGFVFVTDIQFVASTEGSCSGCNPYPRPVPSEISVDNPPSTCVTVGDASVQGDATLSDVEAGSLE